MSWFAVILLSIVEGLTEFLPVSSTAHMTLAAQVFHIPQTEFVKSFEIIVQLGAILSVLVTYWQLLWQRKDLWVKIAAAFVPTTIIGLLLYKLEKTVFLGNTGITLIGLFVGGAAIIVVERWIGRQNQSKEIKDLSFPQAGMVGICQGLAIFPGISRSAATIAAGLAAGLARSEAVVFSFLLALPVMAAATGLDLIKSTIAFSPTEIGQLLVGMIISFGVALATVTWLVRFVQRHSLAFFGWYRIGLVIIFMIGGWLI